jgi:hypothetical protein
MEIELYPKPTLLKYILLAGLLAISNKIFSQTIDFGKSYINITKGNGGTVEPGDTLEIRSSFVVRSGTFDSCGYFDAIPAGTVYIPGTIRVLTNEGKIYKQFTDVAGDDCGWLTAFNVRINLGFVAAAAPATAFRRGRVINTHKPSFFGSTCIMVASFRVRVTAAYNTILNLGGGSMTYRVGLNALQTFTFPSRSVIVYQNIGICPNSVGANSIGTEFNGTFGSGRPRNRAASANVPVGYTYNIFTSNQPNDYFYGIANNTSTNTGYTTLDTWPKPDPSAPTHRVFQVWDIIGDHTGAVSPAAGNPAADTVANGNAGYMLVINAAYRIDSAFQQTISGLCPNTYYEISCWMRNICSKCGCDSNGVGASGAGYIPTALADSAGVRPNLSFDVDGVNYYTTGNLLYTGQWVKKGFTFLTGPVQNSFTMKFFNNAPGGGGNDWALDDITVATCSPNLVLLPSANPTICAGNVVNMSSTVKCFFNNYVYYKWQKSVDNGATWLADGPTGGPAAPTWSGSDWQYTVNHPAFVANMSDSGTRYRLVVATTMANLNSANCSFSEQTVITLHVIDCSEPLNIQYLSFSGEVVNNLSKLTWTTTRESEQLHFIVERSHDGANFDDIGQVNGYNDFSQDINVYTFIDPVAVDGIIYYRVRLMTGQGYRYSRILQFNNYKTGEFRFDRVINPFDKSLDISIISAFPAKAEISLIDMQGRMVRKQIVILSEGENNFGISNTENLGRGIYTLQIHANEKLIQMKVMKK